MVSLRATLETAARLLKPVPGWVIMTLLFIPGTGLPAAQPDPIVKAWLQAQPDLTTWSARVIQTRRLQALTQPLVTPGRVWFSAPNRFRWEIGEPTATIAVRGPTTLAVLYPQLKRAERYDLSSGAANPLQDTLALLDAGFPRTEEDLLGRFVIQNQSLTNELLRLDLAPKTAAAKRILPRISLLISTNDFLLRATELEFADGSTMHNDFHEIAINPSLEMNLFQPSIPADFRLVEPGLR